MPRTQETQEPEIKISIKNKDGESDTNFTDYGAAIDFLLECGDEEMDENHAHVMSEHK